MFIDVEKDFRMLEERAKERINVRSMYLEFKCEHRIYTVVSFYFLWVSIFVD